MTLDQLLRLRLRNQLLIASSCRTPLEAVTRFGAVQAQDYGAARWAVGLRVPGTTGADVDRAFDEGAIVRTHVLRPTWHLVAPEDLRWMVALSASRIRAAAAAYERALGLDAPVLSKCRRIIERALAAGVRSARHAGACSGTGRAAPALP